MGSANDWMKPMDLLNTQAKAATGQNLDLNSALGKTPPAETNPLPKQAPDLADAALTNEQRATLLRTRASQGRRSTFLTGPDGEMSTPAAGPSSSLLGGGPGGGRNGGGY